MDDFSNLPVFTLIVKIILDQRTVSSHSRTLCCSSFYGLLSPIMCVFVLHLQIMFDTYHVCIVTLSKALSAPHSTGSIHRRDIDKSNMTQSLGHYV